MDEAEKELLENLLDSLDRLFDWECQVIDLYAIAFATEHALKPYNRKLALNEYAEALLKIVRSSDSNPVQREKALGLYETDRLRDKLNQLLPF